jgi:hypothetical protein
VSDIEDGGIAEGAIVGAGAEDGGAAVVRGPELYGVSPGPPGFGPGMPIELPPDGLVVCAQTGAENASTAAIATPVKRCFMSEILSLGLQLDMVGRLVWVPLGRVFLLWAAGGIQRPPRSGCIIDRWAAEDPAAGSLGRQQVRGWRAAGNRRTAAAKVPVG